MLKRVSTVAEKTKFYLLYFFFFLQWKDYVSEATVMSSLITTDHMDYLNEKFSVLSSLATF